MSSSVMYAFLSRLAFALLAVSLMSCQAVLGIDDVSGRQPDADPGAPDSQIPDAATPGEDAQPDAQPLACPAAFTEEYNGHGYFVSATAMLRDEAVADCTTAGGHLLVIDDAGENAFVAGLLTTDSWIGYDDLTEEGRFDWFTGVQPGYMNWKELEPNNDNNEDCVGILGPASFGPLGTWNDFDCGEQHTYVCECDPMVELRPVPRCMSDAAYDTILEGRRYRWTGTSASWQAARDVCFADDADLVVIGDAAEQTRIAAAIPSSIWLGLWDRGEDGVGPFEWVTGDATYRHWGPGEPNNTTGQHHAIIDTSNAMYWYDRSSDDPYRVMCECDPESPDKNY